MASIPLPALNVQTQQQPDMLQKFGQLMALRNMQSEQQQREQEGPVRLQILGAQAQTAQIQNQQQQLALQDSQKLRSISPNFVTKGPDGKRQAMTLTGFTTRLHRRE